jgi:uncharacterized protein (TIRG00374 family)
MQARINLLLLGFLIYLLLILNRTLKWFLLIKVIGHQIKYRNFLPFYLANCLISVLTPFKSGEAVTPFVLKKYLKINVSQGFSVIVLDRFFELIVFTLIFIAAFFYATNRILILPKLILSTIQWIFGGFLLLIFVFSLIMLSSKKIIKKTFKIFGFFKEFSLIKKLSDLINKELQIFYDSLSLFQNKKVYKFLIPLTLSSWLFELSAYYLIFNAVFPIPFLDITAAQIISIGAGLISLVPGGLGIAEIGTVYILKLFNYPTTLSAGGALLARFILTGTLLISGVIGIFLIKEKRESPTH